MKRPEKQITLKMVCLVGLGLLLLPLSGMASDATVSAPGMSGIGFFSPPASDISLQVMQNIFGTGTDALNGKLIRPLLMVFSTGIVMFMGAIFAWNLTKFVLHTAQEGEMMVGKGKQMGLVVLRSVFGISMVIPAYGSAGYKGLSLSFLFVAWLITQGIGLADRGTNAIVDYLAAGGTIYQVAQSAKDTSSKQDMVKPVLDILAAQVCVHKLWQFAKARDAQDAAIEEAQRHSNMPPIDPPRVSPVPSDFGYYVSDVTGVAEFGTKNKDASTNKAKPYLSECGTVSFPIDPKDPRKNFTVYVGILQIINQLEPIAVSIVNAFPAEVKPTDAQKSSIDAQVLAGVANAIFNYTNLISPLRVVSVNAETQKAYDTLQSIKQKGWLVLGAYYPLMGNLNQNNKQSLTAYAPTTVVGSLSTGQVTLNPKSNYDLTKLQDTDKGNLRELFKYVASNENNTVSFIGYIEAGAGDTLQEKLGAGTPQMDVGPFTGLVGQAANFINSTMSDYFSSPDDALRRAQKYQDATKTGAEQFDYKNYKDYLDFHKISGIAGNAAQSGWGYATYGIGKAFGLGGEMQRAGDSLGGVLAHESLVKSASAVGLASAVAGPMAWATMPPMLIYFVDIADHFRNAISQAQTADPLLALQAFGFYVMDKAVKLLGIILGGTFVAAAVFGAIPTVNMVGAMGVTANLLSPLIALFFSALALAGIGFGVYIPMIPLIVWISAILGWVGHCFQAIIGAPLVALRMTTAEGEGVLGGATEGIVMLLGVLMTPFLLVVGFSATLILIKQMMIVVNYLFSLFAFYSFDNLKSSYAWIILGIPAILFVYFTLITTMVQALSTKLIGEFPGEVLRHLHTAMTGHKAAEQMMGKVEQSTEKLGGHAGELGGRGGFLQKAPSSGGGGKSKK